MRNLIAAAMDDATICKVTGLTLEEVEAIRNR